MRPIQTLPHPLQIRSGKAPTAVRHPEAFVRKSRFMKVIAMITSRQRFLAAALLASAAFAASAQTPPPAPMPQPGSAAPSTMEPRPAHARDGRSVERFQERRAQRMEELKSQLKLDASQQAAWSNFVAATQPPARGPRPDRAEFEKLTTPQRLDRMQALQADHAARFARRNDATRALYAALKPEQQKVFDVQTLRRGGPEGREVHGDPRHHRMHEAPAKS
jgi:hypothetical protein